MVYSRFASSVGPSDSELEPGQVMGDHGQMRYYLTELKEALPEDLSWICEVQMI